MGHRALLAACIAASAASFARPARAAGPGAWEMSVDVRDYWLRQMPEMPVRAAVETPLRTLPPATLPSTGSQQFLAFTWDNAFAASRRVLVPMVGLQFGWAVGTSPRVMTSIDGSVVEMRPWTADEVSLLLPGLGLRFDERRWMFQATARAVASFTWMNAVVADGSASHDLSDAGPLFAATFGGRVDVEACRRLDPLERACLFVSPALYEYSALNGGSIGLRWELGP